MLIFREDGYSRTEFGADGDEKAEVAEAVEEAGEVGP